MSEDLHQVPGEPEEPGQPEEPLAAASPAQEPLREEPPAPAVSQEAQPVPPLSESIIPEQPAARPAYPPPPEFYAQMPAVNPDRPPAWPAPGMPGYPPAPGFPPPVPGASSFPPPVPGAPLYPLPPGYVYVPVSAGFKYDFPPIPPVEPLPTGQAVRDLPRQYKKILFKPSVRSFLEEQGRAEWGIIWLQLLFQIFIAALISIPSLFFDSQGSNGATALGIGLVATVAELVLVPAFFFAGVGIQYLLARLFKGNGSFKQQAYNQLLYTVPLGVITSLLSALLVGAMRGSPLFTFYLNPASSVTATGTTQVPVLNGGLLIVLLVFELVALVIGVYQIVLNVFSIMATHRMSGGRATAVVLLPYAALVLVYIVFVFVLVFAALSSIH